jgi:hypothetical protein
LASPNKQEEVEARKEVEDRSLDEVNRIARKASTALHPREAKKKFTLNNLQSWKIRHLPPFLQMPVMHQDLNLAEVGVVEEVKIRTEVKEEEEMKEEVVEGVVAKEGVEAEGGSHRANIPLLSPQRSQQVREGRLFRQLLRPQKERTVM